MTRISENREIHQTIPDHRVKLTPDGWDQAQEAGRRLRSLLRADDTLHFFTSPYRRTRETTEGILSTLTSDEEDPSPFKRSNITVHEEPRLREQDFGNFQPCGAEMERMWQERADYGHFFYRIPNGESAADAYDRVSGFNESLYRQFGEDDFASVCVLVTHGLMSRVFLMKWYHFSVEYFEDLRNVNHCEFLIMKKQEDSGKYILQNKLRTWSALRRERAALKAKEDAEQGKDKGDVPVSTSSHGKDSIRQLERQNTTPAVQRRWGGCPEGCNHAKHIPKIRKELADLRLVDEKHAAKSSIVAASNSGVVISTGSIVSRRVSRVVNSSDDDSDDPRGKPGGHGGPKIDVTKAREELVSSPDGTPSFITIEDRLRNHLKSPKFLRVGRDFGGTHSGANSDTEVSEDDARHRVADVVARVKHTNGPNGAGNKGENGKHNESGMGRGAHANRLGDAPASRNCSADGSEDGGDERDENGDENEEEDLDKAEKEDRSIRGSVY